MALALDTSTPPHRWYELLEQRTSELIKRRHEASDAATVPRYVKRFLTADPCTYLEPGGRVNEEALALILAEVMVSDMSGPLPVAYWKNEGSKGYELRNAAEEEIRGYNMEKIAGILGKGEWVQKICGKKGAFTQEDMLPFGKWNEFYLKKTMAGLAEKLDDLSEKAKYHQVQEGEASPDAYRALIIDLGKAATECSDMKTYMRISLFLFLAVNRFWVLISSPESSEEGEEVRDIGRRYLRNYMTLVLLGEELPMLGDIQRKEESPI